MVTATDLTEQHTTSAVFLAGEIYKQGSIDGLQRASARIRELQRGLAAADATAHATGQVITAITDALTIRLIQLAMAQLGPAPIDFAWVAAGSQARSEQTAKSDQDNCLILDDAYDEAQHGEYFKELSRFVCSGLDACGYVFCPGEMMAMTDTWRQPQQRWRQYFRGWVNEPEPKALMLTCVFFDLRLVYGRAALLDDVRSDVLQRTQGNGIFLAYMVSNALGHQPPLGLFGNITTARSGEHRGTIDLKHSGIVPVVDLARVYALAGGHPAVNTHDRLAVAAQSKEVSEQSARDLSDALEFLAVTRIRHQVRQIEANQPTDNFLVLEELSNFERTQLKDAFAVVQTLQSVLAQRYQSGRF
jgi:CBS domain-containing protein